MYRNLQIVFVLVLPILVKSLDTERLVRSLHAVGNKPRQVRRQLLADSGTYPYLVANDLFGNECQYVGSSCEPGAAIIVTDAAPAPDSDVGKFVASLAGKSYVCGSHKTAAECEADTANKCDIYQVPRSATNSTMVEVCDVRATELVRQVANFGLCPKSLADQLFTCMGVKDALTNGDQDLETLLSSMGTSSGSCTSRDGISCELLQGTLCIPTAFKKAYDLSSSSGATQLQNDMQNQNSKFWGCCNGGKILAQEVACQAAETKSTCSGKCVWQAVDDVTGTVSGICTLSNTVIMDMVANGTNAFGNFAKAATDKCKVLTQSACDSSPKVTSASLTKAKELAQLQFAPGGGDCSATTANSADQDRPMAMMAVVFATVAIVLGAYMSL